MRNCAIVALCFVLIGLCLTVVTGSYIGKKTLKETVITVFQNIANFNQESEKEWDVLEDGSQSGLGDDQKETEEAQSLSEAELAELYAELVPQLDDETLEKVNQAIQGNLSQAEMSLLIQEVYESVDTTTKIKIATALASVLGEEDVMDELEGSPDEDTIENWSDSISKFFQENVVSSIQEADIDIDDTIIFNDNYDIMTNDVQKMELGSDITELNLKVGGAAFYVEESADAQFYVEAENTSRFQVYVENQCLYVKTLKTSGSTMDNSKVTLYVPAGVQLDALYAELGAGQLKLTGINATRQDISVGAGQIVLEDMQAQKMNVEVGMGELLAGNIVVDELVAEVGMGHMSLEGAIGVGADIECAMGSVELVCSGAYTDFNYTIEGALGDVEIDGTHYSGVVKEQKINNNASKLIEVECAMGNVVIDF